MPITNEPGIRAEIQAIINGLGFGAITYPQDAINLEQLHRASVDDVDGITIEIGDEQTQNQFTVTRIAGRGGAEQGGTFRIDWLHTVRLYMSAEVYSHDQITARAVAIMEELLTHATLGGRVTMMWSPPAMIEIDMIDVSDRSIWFGAMTVGWSQFVDVIQT